VQYSTFLVDENGFDDLSINPLRIAI